eukprot:CAMPEP_0114428120 /NCGR_PEP_ID=MMETSP0103-20121206/8751_1 /TAXON_ID=37642 ORGANISM="Paraphysomonas imperforata, Strain PA2" /NCGR_SAMPLE_ID=MMETSP0103 /ASSEMBLY_ACC=CAM_ASM_000201 /LENGTH=958 /DNA_ID=CAMNT_0001597305 /DNA_START=40 /DNA_END=2916 /DNA_ORIENTATION=+
MDSEKADAAAAKQLAHFDHSYKAYLHTVTGPALSTFGQFKKEKKDINLNCTTETFEIEMDALALADRKKATLAYSQITEVGFDHDRCEVKFTMAPNTPSPGADKAESSTVIMGIPSTVEFEHEIKLRFTHQTSGMKAPPVTYVGMFAGSTKPKPFQRKRPNISTIPTGKLPPLSQMRETAFSRHLGAYKPCPPGESRRLDLAMQHIFEGHNTFPITNIRGDQTFFDKWTRQSVLVITEEKLEVRPRGVTSEPMEVLFDDVSSWDPHDTGAAPGNGECGIYVSRKSTDKRLYIGVKFLRDVKHTLEFFWNKHQISEGRPVMPGSTHGRPLETVYTLSGEEPAGPSPEGSQDIVDMDGIVVKPGQMVKVGNRTEIKAHKHVSLGAPTHEMVKLPHENKAVKEHWRHVVKHQGWLLKQGGIGIGTAKKWQKRYFVLYSTSQGHFLVYYSDMLACPMYSEAQEQRNVIDMSKAVFIRPGSTKHADTPAHSFDLVTIEREFTLCAETQENAHKWLHMLTRAVDEDVAILPDEDLLFKVKAKVDPLAIFNPMDYNTHVMVSANCVNVSSPTSEMQGKRCSWIYTDFYKWSLISEKNKLALMISVFSDETFKRRLEFHFRTKEAVRLATAIEFFIEKFMSVMHIMLEVLEPLPEKEVEVKPASKTPVEQAPPPPESNLLDFMSDEPPVPSVTTSSTFSDDPFGGGGGSTNNIDALSEGQIAQHKVWLQAARLNGGGPLYDDGAVQIACKTEVRGSQGRFTLFYRNKSSVHSVENLTSVFSDTLGFLRSQAGPLPSSLAPGEQVEQQVMIECMKPSDVSPSLTVSYKERDGPLRKNSFELPLHMTLFNDPLPLSSEDFQKRWQMLTGPGQEGSVCVIKMSTLSVEDAAQIFEKILKFSRVQGAPTNCLQGAASLRTGATNPTGDKITLGCLMMVEISGVTLNVTCRTVHAAATTALATSVKHIFSD